MQVLIRVRPLNSMERSTNGYNRCLKQEGSQTITWVGHPEARFTFDHVACETVDQVWLQMRERCVISCPFFFPDLVSDFPIFGNLAGNAFPNGRVAYGGELPLRVQ